MQTNTQTDRQTDTHTHTDTQIHRHTDRYTDTQTHRHTDTQTHRQKRHYLAFHGLVWPLLYSMQCVAPKRVVCLVYHIILYLHNILHVSCVILLLFVGVLCSIMLEFIRTELFKLKKSAPFVETVS